MTACSCTCKAHCGRREGLRRHNRSRKGRFQFGEEFPSVTACDVTSEDRRRFGKDWRKLGYVHRVQLHPNSFCPRRTVEGQPSGELSPQPPGHQPPVPVRGAYLARQGITRYSACVTVPDNAAFGDVRHSAASLRAYVIMTGSIAKHATCLGPRLWRSIQCGKPVSRLVSLARSSGPAISSACFSS